MRVLVTGGGGFIGSALVVELLSRQHTVACLVRRPDAVPADLPWLGRVEVIHGDLSSPAGWAEKVASWRPDGCVHAAWFTDPATYLQAEENVWLLESSLGLITALAAARCRQAVFLGTCAEYETSDSEALTESSPLRPTTLYASSKVALELLGRRRAEAAGIRFAWARLFHPYGPREKPGRLIPSAALALSEGRTFTSLNPDARRDFIHVDDVAAAIASLLDAGSEGPYNISTGRATSVRDALDLLAAAAGRVELLDFGSQPRQDWDPGSVYGSNDRLAAATGWKPRIMLADGLASTYAWWAGQQITRDAGGSSAASR